MENILKKLKVTKAFIKSVTDLEPQLGIVFGSGLSSEEFLDTIVAKIPYKDIPHFSLSTVKNHKGEIKHLIAKYQIIPEKDGYGILSFDDVTELRLLKLFDASQTNIDEKMQDTQAMFDLLEVIQRNSAKIELHNYYKGLSITNDALIEITIFPDTPSVLKSNSML